MADAFSAVKGTAKKNKQELLANRSLLHFGNTPLSTASSSRLSLISSGRLHSKGVSSSLEKLSFISEKEENGDLDDYHLEYSAYLLRKVQSRLLAQSREQKEENVKRCFVALKLELEGLLDKYVKLSKDIGYFKIFLDILRESNSRIEDGSRILKILRENKFEDLMKSLSCSLGQIINQLQLIDIDKSSVEELFSRQIWGSGSELEECLKKINEFISKNKDEVSNIAGELVEIKKLGSDNALLRERFHSVFEKFSNEFLETNYKLFTGIVRSAFNQRQECGGAAMSNCLNCLNCDLTEFLQPNMKLANEQFTFQLSEFDGSYPVTPNSASTPQHN